MALTNIPSTYFNPDGMVEFDTQNHAIGGKMVIANTTVSQEYMEVMRGDPHAKEAIKRKLAIELGSYMIENNLTEFTQQQDPINDTIKIACRVFVTPDEQIRLLRTVRKV